jgi:hypothetical protein
LLVLNGEPPHYVAFSSVLVQIGTHHGTRGCNNPTKASIPLLSIYDLPNA